MATCHEAAAPQCVVQAIGMLRLSALYCVFTAVFGVIVGSFTGPSVLAAGLAHALMAALFFGLAAGIRRRSRIVQTIAVCLLFLISIVGLGLAGHLARSGSSEEEPSRWPMIAVLILMSGVYAYAFMNLTRPEAFQWCQASRQEQQGHNDKYFG